MDDLQDATYRLRSLAEISESLFGSVGNVTVKASDLLLILNAPHANDSPTRDTRLQKLREAIFAQSQRENRVERVGLYYPSIAAAETILAAIEGNV